MFSPKYVPHTHRHCYDRYKRGITSHSWNCQESTINWIRCFRGFLVYSVKHFHQVNAACFKAELLVCSMKWLKTLLVLNLNSSAFLMVIKVSYSSIGNYNYVLHMQDEVCLMSHPLQSTVKPIFKILPSVV